MIGGFLTKMAISIYQAIRLRYTRFHGLGAPLIDDNWCYLTIRFLDASDSNCNLDVFWTTETRDTKGYEEV